MSKMQSEACCTVPPVQAKNYEAKGKYIEVDGMKCYTTGPSDASSAILIIYDVFGYYPQTLQGADILANAASTTSGPPHKHYQVFMPDFFHGSPFPLSSFPPKTDEQKSAMGEFFSGPAAPAKNVEAVHSLIASLKKSHPNITKWGALGMCWGGKIISLTSQAHPSSGPPTPFTAAAEVHPAMVEPADAAGITIPMCMLASGDEDGEAVKGFEGKLGGDKYVETFGDQVHGWMAARADLEDERVRGEYERGYKVLLDWFGKYL